MKVFKFSSNCYMQYYSGVAVNLYYNLKKQKTKVRRNQHTLIAESLMHV